MKKYLTILLVLLTCAFFLTGAINNKTTVISKGTTKGTFVKVEWGDYAHFVINDSKGKEQSYFIMKMAPKTLEDLQKNKTYKSQKVTVSWRKVKTYIPEAGGYQVITELVGFKFYK